MYSNQVFRCSQLGKLMTGLSVGLTSNQDVTFNAYHERFIGNGKPLTDKQLADYYELGHKKYGKKVGLSVTTQTFLKELHRENIFGRSKEHKNKYTDKGIQVEEQTFSLFTRTSKSLVLKNKERLTNEFITGELDVNDKAKRLVREFKSSWDFSTFPFFETEVPNSDYDWQIQGYLDLTGYDEAELIYGLVDTPFKLIDDELRRLDWKHNIFTNDGDVKKGCIDLVVETVSNLIYSEEGLKKYVHQSSMVELDWFHSFKQIPEELRVKVFKVYRNDNKINAFKNQIGLCREYMNGLVENNETK